MVSHPGGAPVMDIDRINDVFIAAVHDDISLGDSHGFELPQESVMMAPNVAGHGSNVVIQHGSLSHFHLLLGHLCYDTIIKMARDTASGIKLTDTKRTNCLACAQGKQTKRVQSRKDSEFNASIDVIGGVICSDLKGPMTPRDWLSNRYLINFVDYR